MEHELTRAQALATQGAYAQAEALLRRQLEHEPNSKPAWDLLGFVLFFQAQYARAEECCRKALQLVPDDPYATKGLGLCLAKLGQVEEGLRQIEKAATLRPAWFDAYWDWIVVLHDAGRDEDARAVLARAELLLPARAADFAGLKQALRQG